MKKLIERNQMPDEYRHEITKYLDNETIAINELLEKYDLMRTN